MEPHLAVGDERTRLVGDIDPPQLLSATLVEGHPVNLHGPGGHGTEST
jgi:hypothetical protein